MSRFKAQALAIVESVSTTGEEVVITKRGKPVARLVPMRPPAGLLGSVQVLVSDDELIEPTGEAWEAEAAHDPD
ncbi:MAG: type II toxin-antitoxin system Phd/YefM family antitoxin [Candidatus Dormibacteria bacterium]